VPVAWVPAEAHAPAAERETGPSSVDSLGALAVDRDPFRLTRAPATTAYSVERQTQPAIPLPPKPALALVGIVWEGGHNPTAVLTGVPGIEGNRVVRTGDVVAGLRVRQVLATSVRITGMDTAWTLTLLGLKP